MLLLKFCEVQIYNNVSTLSSLLKYLLEWTLLHKNNNLFNEKTETFQNLKQSNQFNQEKILDKFYE